MENTKNAMIEVEVDGQKVMVERKLFRAVQAKLTQTYRNGHRLVKRENAYHWPYGATRPRNALETAWNLDKWDPEREIYTDGRWSAEELQEQYDDYLESIGQKRMGAEAAV